MSKTGCFVPCVSLMSISSYLVQGTNKTGNMFTGIPEHLSINRWTKFFEIIKLMFNIILGLFYIICAAFSAFLRGKHWKYWFLPVCVLCLFFLWVSCAYDEKSTFLIIFKHFSLFATMWMHAQVCVRWLKYTTFVQCATPKR